MEIPRNPVSQFRSLKQFEHPTTTPLSETIRMAGICVAPQSADGWWMGRPPQFRDVPAKHHWVVLETWTFGFAYALIQ